MKANFQKAKIDATYEFIPSLSVPTDEGDIPNRNLPKSEQIKVTLKRAKREQIEGYIDTEYSIAGDKRKTSFRYDAAITGQVIRIKGLESVDISTAKDLLDNELNYSFIQTLIQELFLEIISPDNSSARGGLSAGE